MQERFATRALHSKPISTAESGVTYYCSAELTYDIKDDSRHRESHSKKRNAPNKDLAC